MYFVGMLRRVWRRLRWRPIDEILFECLPSTLPEPPQVEVPLVISTHTAKAPTGIADIDRRIGNRWCYVGWLNGEVAHTNFASFDCHLTGQFGYEAGIPVLCDGFTKKQYRGQRMQSAVLHKMITDLLEAGHSRVYTLVAPDNTASLRGVARAGFVPVARLRGARLFGILFIFRVDKQVYLP